jgi:hypothetical protein
MSQQQQHDCRSELLRVLKIGHEDLEANRQGVLGARQRQRLVRSGRAGT